MFVRPVFSRLVVFVALGLALSGCATDSHFMVEKKDVSALTESVDKQSERIKRLETRTGAQLQSISLYNDAATRTIISAITKQNGQQSCPPMPEQPVCATASSGSKGDGQANRLKGKVVVGELENFYLVGANIVHTARIDSGAQTSSLDARNITRFERDGKNWVRFDVPLPQSEGSDESGESDNFITLESEISRSVKIIQSSAGAAERRAVVELQFMIGNHRQQAEFTLTDRSHLSHTVLIGRNILRDVMLIDVGKEYATELPDPLPNSDNGEDE